MLELFELPKVVGLGTVKNSNFCFRGSIRCLKISWPVKSINFFFFAVGIAFIPIWPMLYYCSYPNKKFDLLVISYMSLKKEKKLLTFSFDMDLFVCTSQVCLCNCNLFMVFCYTEVAHINCNFLFCRVLQLLPLILDNWNLDLHNHMLNP